ncbi:MAG: hypothetical protein NTU47_18810 [Ignavibacteriales bacterium]|nr:hypothetical protein [Ignavibacteriales bacterium]
MIDWLSSHPLIAGVVTFLLAWVDWLLTIMQERERQLHYADHYESYPVNTIEGNQRYQTTVNAKRIVEPRHLIPAFIMTAIVTFAIVWVPENFRPLLLGYVWGLYLIVSTTHLGNLLGYKAGRHGLHGKIYLHQRTGYLMQMGRYFALSLFLILLAVCSASLFIVGVAVGGVSSAARQLVWMRKIPTIGESDEAPSSAHIIG